VKPNTGTPLHNAPQRGLPDIPPHMLIRLQEYVRLLREWKPVTNLLSNRAFDDVWFRHIADCVPLIRLAPEATRWLDIGAGAGLPSVVVACHLADVQGACVYSVDSDRRKCVFLREVARKLRLPMRVYNRRAESLSPAEFWPVDVITARAFAALPKILGIAEPFLSAGAVALLPRGKTATGELAEIDNNCYSCEPVPNMSGGDGVIFHITRRKLASTI